MQLFEKIWSGKTSREREGAYRGLGLTQCPHADSPTDVRSPRQCGPRQTQANSNLVIVPPESDSQVTQVAIGWGGFLRFLRSWRISRFRGVLVAEFGATG